MEKKVQASPHRYLTKSEAAELLGVCERTISRLIARGDLDAIKLRPSQSGAVRISTQAIEEFTRNCAA